MFLYLLLISEFSFLEVPKPGILSHGTYEISLRLEPEGGMLFGGDVGFFDLINIGLGYGGKNIIGKGSIEWNKEPTIRTKLGVLHEESHLLNLSLGYASEIDFFIMVGRSLDLYYSLLEFGGGISYSPNNLGFIGGIEGTLGENISLVSDLVLFRKNSHWNIGAKFSIEESIYFKFFITDPFDREHWRRSATIGIINIF